jgi:hypothetical protein
MTETAVEKTQMEQLREWVATRLKNPDGSWITSKDPCGAGSDVMFCILCAMENLAPGCDEYIYLVQTAREFLVAHPSDNEEEELEARLVEDSPRIP